MSLERHAKIVGLLMLAGLLSGCGDGTGGAPQAPVASDQADGGQAAAQSIKSMQPPPPPKSNRR
ncbi:hypothetical protein TA3x_001516 [Tundrisphaera sp. TA3]|uniref:hypothetical protein n=1 Tax=Tundrisphaera sp. TA3 TaxID=3435775 RepID=UPI003EC06657